MAQDPGAAMSLPRSVTVVPPGNAIAIRPEVIRPDHVTVAGMPTVGDLLHELTEHVRSAVDRLEDPECGPAAHEVGRWLRLRLREIQQRPFDAGCDGSCCCHDDDDW